MESGFKVSKHLTLPTAAIAWAITFVAKRGAGKTYNTAVYVEELVRQKIMVLVIDGMGVWWGLRIGVDKDGRPDSKKPGLPVVIIGGKHADIQLDPGKVEKVVEALLQTNTSAVLDISQFRKGEQMRIATIFAEEFYRLADVYPGERVLVVEEADMFAPQKPFHEEARCLNAFEDLVKRGGNRNIGMAMITQRSADFNKNLLTQSDCLIVGRLTAPQDKQAIQAWVEKHSEKDKKELNAWYDSLSHLKKGEVWVWNDDEEFPIFQKVQFRKRETFHATRKFILTKQAHEVQLGDASEFIERFKDKFEPKPKEQPKATPVLQKVIPDHGSNQVKTSKTVIPPPVPSREPSQQVIPERVSIQTPQLVLQKVSPSLLLPANLTETPSPLARVVTVLVNGPAPKGKDSAWTAAAIKRLLADHGWPDDGMDEAVRQLTAWEILVWRDTAGYYTFQRTRVRVLTDQQEVPVE